MSRHRNNSTWGRGGNISEDNVARVVAALLGAWAASREEKRQRRDAAPFAQPAVRGNVFTNNCADLAARKKKKLFTAPFCRGKNICRPVPSRKSIPLIFTVPSRREVMHPLFRPVPSSQLLKSLFYRPGRHRCANLTGGVDRPATSGKRITAAATISTTTCDAFYNRGSTFSLKYLLIDGVP